MNLIKVFQLDKHRKFTRFIVIGDKIVVTSKQFMDILLAKDARNKQNYEDMVRYKHLYIRFKAKYLAANNRYKETLEKLNEYKNDPITKANNRKITATTDRRGSEIYYEIDPEGKKRRVSKEYALKMADLGFYD